MKRQTKSARIIDLLAKTDLTREEIAARVGCLPAYVRVVEQRLAAAPGEAPGRRWQKRNIDRQRKYSREYMRRRRHADPEFRERQLKYSREWARERYRNDPEFRQKRLEAQRVRRARKRAEIRA